MEVSKRHRALFSNDRLAVASGKFASQFKRRREMGMMVENCEINSSANVSHTKKKHKKTERNTLR